MLKLMLLIKMLFSMLFVLITFYLPYILGSSVSTTIQSEETLPDERSVEIWKKIDNKEIVTFEETEYLEKKSKEAVDEILSRRPTLSNYEREKVSEDLRNSVLIWTALFWFIVLSLLFLQIPTILDAILIAGIPVVATFLELITFQELITIIAVITICYFIAEKRNSKKNLDSNLS